MPVRKIAGRVGGGLLALTAAFHATGFVDIRNFAASLPDQGFMAQALPGIWLLPAIHWFAMALAAIVALRFDGYGSRFLLIGIAIIISFDPLNIVLSVGPFVGAGMLAVAALLIGVAATEARTNRP